MAMHPARRDRLTAQFRAAELDGLLITNPLNVTYLTGFTGESSPLVLTLDRVILVSDGRFTEQIAEECPGLDSYIRPTSQTIQEAAVQVLGKLALARVGFESAHLTVADRDRLAELAPTITWVPGNDRVEKLRTIKDAGELGEIRAALAIAEKAFALFKLLLRAEDTEKELVDALESYVRRLGGKGTAFPPIVAVGARAALPHAPPSQHRVGESPCLLVDWGAAGRLYKSDLTRVLWTNHNAALRNAPSGVLERAKVQRVYEVVLTAQRRAIAAIRPGVKAAVVDSAARVTIGEAGFGEFFNHGLGHGFGLQIHEAPFVKPGSELVLQAGMVVTVEPGIYLPGEFGVRIEDDVLVTEDGCEVLSTVPREFEECIVEV